MKATAKSELRVFTMAHIVLIQPPYRVNKLMGQSICSKIKKSSRR